MPFWIIHRLFQPSVLIGQLYPKRNFLHRIYLFFYKEKFNSITTSELDSTPAWLISSKDKRAIKFLLSTKSFSIEMQLETQTRSDPIRRQLDSHDPVNYCTIWESLWIISCRIIQYYWKSYTWLTTPTIISFASIRLALLLL